MRRLIGLLLLLVMLCGGCATQPPPHAMLATPALRLPPSALPEPLAMQQRLTFIHGERRDTVDALVESDASGTRLVLQALGQVALRLDWDGATLQQQRAPWLPAALDGERVLTDLQLVYWPIAAIEAALPSGWTLGEEQGARILRKDGEVVTIVDYPQPSQARLRQQALGYVLEIESEAMP